MNTIYFGWLVVLGSVFGLTSQAWATTSCTSTSFIPVTQCFRDAGASGWIMQRYSNNLPISTVPLTAASTSTTGDVAGQGWLRLTDNTNNQSGTAYYNLPVNVTLLGIQAQFSYTSWGGSGADGISFYLFDGSTTTASYNQGVFGGGLGYCQQYNYGGVTLNGLSNAVVGFGIDDWSNFENNWDRCTYYGENGRLDTPYGAIGVRGPGNGIAGYKWLADNTSLGSGSPTWYSTSSSTRPSASTFYRNVQVNISPNTVGTTSYTVNGSWATTSGGAYTSLISAPYPAGNAPPSTSIIADGEPTASALFTPPYAATVLPATIKFGFAASTGGATNYHEIQDAYITEGLPDIAVTQNVVSAYGGYGVFLVTVTNLGSTAATASFTAAVTNLTGVVWSCTPSGGSTCPAASGVGAPTSQTFTLGLAGNVSFTIEGQAVTGTTISDAITVTNGAGFTDMCPDNNDNTHSLCPLCASSLAIGTAGTTHLNLSQSPQTTNSAVDNTVNGAQVQTTNQVYIAKYTQANWWGQLLAYNLTASSSSSTSTLTGISSLANWDASCNLTGGVCNTVTGTPTVTAQSPAGRTILTWNGTQGVSFAYSSLSSSEQSALNADPILGSTGLSGSNVVDYLRGVRTYEQNNPTSLSTPGPFRTRSGVLGDIVDSTPVWVGPPQSYTSSSPWADLLYSSAIMPENTSASANSYLTYAGTYANRTNLVYVGSNDGMVHGFSAGDYVGGVFDTSSTVNTGAELLAYMPSTVLTQIANNTATFPYDYNFTDPGYTHRYFVNATPASGDLYYNGGWHTWLVGGLGGGGVGIYALDVSNPSNFSPSNASSLVVNELNTSNLTCTNPATGASSTTCQNDLGWTYGTPIIQRMHNGNWAVIFGNGYDSSNEHGSIFIASISNTGGWTVYELSTNSQLPNGISYVTPADLDGDNVVDYLYAADLFGNIWRFDVTSSNPANWLTSTYGSGTTATPLYTASNAAGLPQPVTAALQVMKTKQGGLNRVVIMFGTGKNIEAADLLPNNTADGVQTIYGVWDYDMTSWNAKSFTDYAALTAPQTISRSVMQQQTITHTFDNSGNDISSTPYNSSATYRTLSATTVCWKGASFCATNNQLGFYLDLNPDGVTAGEDAIYNPIQIDNVFIINTTVPSAQTQGLTCYAPAPPGGWTMVINPLNGGGLPMAAFPNTYKIAAAGQNFGGVGSPTIVEFHNQNYLITKTAGGGVTVTKINLGGGVGKRLSWIQLR